MSLLKALDFNRIEGYIDREEGARLAEYASSVPADQAIIELGSASGSGALYLASGAKAGLGAHVYCFDPYQEANTESPEHYRDSLAFKLFEARMAYCRLEDQISVIISTARDGAGYWRETQVFTPVGLLHMDALHDYENTRDDFNAWRDLLVPGGVVVFHDVFNDKHGWRVADFLSDTLRHNPEWNELGWYRWSRYRKRRGQAVYMKR